MQKMNRAAICRIRGSTDSIANVLASDDSGKVVATVEANRATCGWAGIGLNNLATRLENVREGIGCCAPNNTLLTKGVVKGPECNPVGDRYSHSATCHKCPFRVVKKAGPTADERNWRSVGEVAKRVVDQAGAAD